MKASREPKAQIGPDGVRLGVGGKAGVGADMVEREEEGGDEERLFVKTRARGSGERDGKGGDQERERDGGGDSLD